MTTLLSESYLTQLNSLTKYPSIPTYHVLGEKGRLSDAVQIRFEQECMATEKIDGTNARLICTPDGVLVGSREDLLWATGDLIHNPAMGIVATLRQHAHTLLLSPPTDSLLVIYGEVFGRNVGAGAKNYTSGHQTGFRVFDAFQISLAEVFRLLREPLEKIALWRENGGQPFFEVSALDALARERGFDRVPNLGSFPAYALPSSLEETATFLQPFAQSAAILDASGLGQSEGIVLRSRDRRRIAKLRFEDYRRTLKGRQAVAQH